MNKTLLENVCCMLSIAGISKFFWAEVLAYACYFVNKLSSSAIGGKAPVKIWSGRVDQDYDSLSGIWLFGLLSCHRPENEKRCAR